MQTFLIVLAVVLQLNSVLSISDRLEENVDKILKYFLNKENTMGPIKKVEAIVKPHPQRLSGTLKLERAINYTKFLLEKTPGLKVYTEEAPVPRWIRKNDRLMVNFGKFWHSIPILAIGGSVPTSGILEAEAIMVDSFEKLDALGSQKLKGKIVFYNHKWTTYTDGYKFRTIGPNIAAKYGAKAVILRSITSLCDDYIHTGTLKYKPNEIKVPACTISCRDANILESQYRRSGKLPAMLKILSYPRGTATSRNLIAEMRGSEIPEEVVLLSAHLDSWDVGMGAYDDGTGVSLNWHVLDVLTKLGIKPRRTLRAIFFTGEEQGYFGSRAYFQKHNTTSFNETIVFAAETDTGSFSPVGLNFTGPEQARDLIKDVLALAEPLNDDLKLFNARRAGDIALWLKAGVPSVWYENRSKHDLYFKHHHSDHDILSNVNATSLNEASSLWTVMAYVIADNAK